MRFGLVGTGPWAQMAHGPGLVAAEGVELVGIWGRLPGRAAASRRVLGIAAYDDYPALLADIDAVAFAVPPGRPGRAGTAGRLRREAPAAGQAGRDRRGRARAQLADAIEATGWRRSCSSPTGSSTAPARGSPRSNMLAAGRRLDAVAQRTSRAGQPVRRVTVAARARRAVGHRPARVVHLITALGPVASLVAVAGVGDLVT